MEKNNVVEKLKDENVTDQPTTSLSQSEILRKWNEIGNPVVRVFKEIHQYLVDIVDEWLAMKDNRKYEPANIQVYNHIMKELDDLEEYAKKWGVDL